MNYLFLAIGAIAGAICRYHAVRLIQADLRTTFPVGTFVVNVSGSVLLGLLSGLVARHPDWPITAIQTLAGFGFCATYTTFSSYIFESTRLWQQGARRAACGNVIGQAVLGCLGAWVGMIIALA